MIFRRRKSHPLTSSADKTHLVSLGGRPETGAIRVFHRRQEWLQLMRILIFFRSGYKIYTLR